MRNPSAPNDLSMHYENRLSALRRTWALTQAELGSLLGLSEDAISSYERAIHDPAIAAAIGLELLFDKPLAVIFPTTAFFLARRMLNALAELSIEVEGQVDTDAETKRALISGTSERIERIIPGI